MKKHPKVTIVTVCYNSEDYLEDCIKSIMNQTYDNIEHIIIDGKSTDNTVSIIKKYENKYNMHWISEEDNGMYDALYKGFNMATGDIYAWLNSDDMYMPWTCELVATVMENTKIEWCTGIPCHYNEAGIAHNIPRITPSYPRIFIKNGYMDGRICTFLEQESMFWSKELWNKCGQIIKDYQMAGDYYLWRQFAGITNLYTIDSVISGFRIHNNQKSSNRDGYYHEVGKLSIGQRVLKSLHVVPLFVLLFSLTTKKYRIRTRKYLI